MKRVCVLEASLNMVKILEITCEDKYDFYRAGINMGMDFNSEPKVQLRVFCNHFQHSQ